MSLRFISAVAVGVLAAAAMIAGPIAAASASNVTLQRDLIRAAPKIKRSELRISAAFKHFEKTGSPAHVISAGKAEDRVLSGLRAELKRTPASSASGTKAKQEIVKGLGLILASNYSFNTHLRKGGHITMKELKAEQKKAEKGSKAFKDGTKLLLRS